MTAIAAGALLVSNVSIAFASTENVKAGVMEEKRVEEADTEESIGEADTEEERVEETDTEKADEAAADTSNKKVRLLKEETSSEKKVASLHVIFLETDEAGNDQTVHEAYVHHKATEAEADDEFYDFTFGKDNLKLPKVNGVQYKLAQEADTFAAPYGEETEVFVYVMAEETPSEKKVASLHVKFFETDEAGNDKLVHEAYAHHEATEAEADDAYYEFTFGKDDLNLPNVNGVQYKLAQEADTFAAPYGEETEVFVYVIAEEKENKKNVIINYLDREGNFVYTGQIQIDEDDNIVNTSELKDVPYGWVVAITGDLRLNEDGTLTVTVEPKVYQKNVIINYLDREGNFVYTGQIQIDEDDNIVNTSELKDVPYGWVVAITGDLRLNEDGTLTVIVEPKVYTKEVKVNYVDREGNAVGEGKLELEENDDIVNTNELKDVPEGYQVAIVGDLRLNEDGSLTVTVEPKGETPTPSEKVEITITFVDKNGKEIGTGTATVDKDATTVKADQINGLPAGYEFDGDTFDIADGKATVQVKEKQPAPQEQQDAKLIVKLMYGNTQIGEDQVFTANGPVGQSYVFTKDNAKVEIPSKYSSYYFTSTLADTTVAFGETKTVTLELGKKNTGNGGGSGSGGGGGAVSTGTSGTLAGGAWKLDDKGWWYQYTNSTYAKNGWYTLQWQDRLDWYYFDANGYLVSGWYTDANGVKYYLHPLHDGRFGYMYTGWNKVDGAWQFFNDDTQNGVYGAWVQGMPVPAELANL